MKKQLFFALTFLSITFMSAQENSDPDYGFSKGDTFITGSVGYSNSKQGDFKSNTFTFAPSVGYFVSDNIALNAGLLFGSSNSDNSALLTNDQTIFGGNLGAMYYFTPEEQFSFFLSLQASYQTNKVEQSSLPDDIRINSFGATFSPGINYFVSENFSLNASLGAISYFSNNSDDAAISDFDQFGFNLDLSNIGLGLTYRF